MMKFVIFTIFAIFAISSVQAGIVASGFVAPYATSYNAHTVNHAIAQPYAQYVAAAPAVLPAQYVAGPAAYSAYSALPAASYFL